MVRVGMLGGFQCAALCRLPHEISMHQGKKGAERNPCHFKDW